MTLIQAERILNPETSAATLEEIEYLAVSNGQEEKAQAVEDACIIGAVAIRELIEKESKTKKEATPCPNAANAENP